MSDYISRKAAIEAADKYANADGCNGSDVAIDIVSELIAIPAADVVEVRHGFWQTIERGENGYSAGDFRCSICGKPNKCWTLTDFCPNCGAKMER